MPQYLKYELKYESGAWRYRLRLNDADDCLEFGKVTCKVEGVDVLYCIPKLTAYLQNSLSKCRDRARLQHLCISFRDELLLSEGNPYKAAVCIESPDKQAPHRV